MLQKYAGLKGNAADYLLERISRNQWEDRVALVKPDRDVTFGEIATKANKLGNFLKSIGIGQGDRIMLNILDGEQYEAVFLGALKVGAVNVPINTYLKAKDYAYYIKDSGVKVVFVDASLMPLITEVVGSIKADVQLIVTDGSYDGYLSFDEAIANVSGELESVDSAPDDQAFWVYSSGSTGDPKGVIHTHDHIYWATELFGLNAVGLNEDDVILCPAKMFYAYGLGFEVYMPLRAGSRVLLETQVPKPQLIMEKLIKHQPTVLAGLPTIYVSLLELFRKMDAATVKAACSRLRFCVSGGEILPPALYHAWKEMTGTEILDAVGTSEMTHMFMMNRPGEVVLGSSGKLIDGYTARIVDDDWNDVPEGEVGNLFVTGPTAATSYWNKPEKTAKSMRDGGVLSGDKFYRDPDGNYFYVGRFDDMLKIDALWVSPSEIEVTISAHPAVLECAVIAVPDENNLQRIKAFITLKPEFSPSQALANDVYGFLRKTLAHYKCPKVYAFITELPKTTTGKIQRFRLRNADGDTSKPYDFVFRV